jgi:hypothetical protein
LPAQIAVFLAQGANDVIVRPKVTEDYAAALCGAGSKVSMLLMPTIGWAKGRAQPADQNEPAAYCNNLIGWHLVVSVGDANRVQARHEATEQRRSGSENWTP